VASVGIVSPVGLSKLAEEIEQALHVRLERRESSFLGDLYFRGELDGKGVVLVENRDPEYREGDPLEDQWFSAADRDCTALIRLDWATDAEPLRELLARTLGYECRLVDW
jgi:hypothetical protein